jgi:hypothetical protein
MVGSLLARDFRERCQREAEILVDARCAWDVPEYRKDTVVRKVLGMRGRF